MAKQDNNTNRTLVAQIEAMLVGESTDTRAAVAALALPGRIRAFSPHFAALCPDDQVRLTRLVNTQIAAGQVDSATGISAALALNWCEARGFDYKLSRRGDFYRLERLS